MLLSLCLGLFLADGIVSLVDDSLTVCFGLRVLMPVRGMVLFCATVMAVLVYGLMALTPMIPKRLFVPVALFNPVAALVMVPVLIYAYGRHPQAAWLISAGQVVLGLSLLGRFRSGLKPGWPLVREEQLELKRFSWLNLTGFVLVNVFVLLPAVAGYLFVCASLAVGHFSEGFLALRPAGLTVQVRTYVRNDGKKIQLAPMAHVGEAQGRERVGARVAGLVTHGAVSLNRSQGETGPFAQLGDVARRLSRLVRAGDPLELVGTDHTKAHDDSLVTED